MNPINIVFSVDDNYVMPMCVATYSIIKNTKVNVKDVNFYIISADLSLENEQLITQFFEKHALQLNILHVKKEDFASFYTSNHITTSAYYRIMAPELIKEVDRFIYLDCDLIVETSLEELFNQQLHDNVIGAVTDLGGFHRCAPLGITNGKYFNSGVLLIDANAWRKQNLTHRLLEFIVKNPDNLELHDQDALNALLSEQWFEINNKWNKQTVDYFTDFNTVLPLYKKIKQDAINYKGISHFTSFGKPWKIYCPHPQRKEFYSYYKQVGFNEALPIETFEYHHKDNQEPCVLFGTSSLAKQFMESFPYLKVMYFLDNNKSKHGSEFFGVPVFLPESVDNLNQYKIYICSSYYFEIKKQLEGLGLLENKHFFRI